MHDRELGQWIICMGIFLKHRQRPISCLYSTQVFYLRITQETGELLGAVSIKWIERLCFGKLACYEVWL